MSSANPTELFLRPATRGDALTLAEVHLMSRAAAVRSATMPASVHSDEEIRSWLIERLASDETWVAEIEGTVVAYLRLSGEWLDDLYVVPSEVGRGVGSALLEVAKALRPGGFGLWVFETNLPARGFYAAHGLGEMERTDGSDNEERSPDIRMSWEP